MRRRERGFTLLEVLVSSAIFAVAGFVLIGLVHEYTLSARALAAGQHARADVSRLLVAWDADSASAESVFIPDKDVLGADDTVLPHEVDFYAKDSTGRPFFWAYFYDARAKTLQRYTFGALGSSPKKDGNPYANVLAFAPSLHPISEISNPASPIYMPLLAAAADHDVALGVNPNIVGGTHVVHIELATPNERTPVDLQAGAAPSGFTVVLNYTPAPTATPAPTSTPAPTPLVSSSPTPASGVLVVWPPAVQYPVAGTALASAVEQSHDLGALLNAALGGGIAAAAFPACAIGEARAFSDTSFSTPWPAGTDPYGAGVSVAANGCYSGAIVAHEPNYYAAFTLAPGTCGFSVNPGSWNAAGPTAFIDVAAANGAVPLCSMQGSDGNVSIPVAVQILAPSAFPCAADSFGYCALLSSTSRSGPTSCFTKAPVTKYNYFVDTKKTYAVYNSQGVLVYTDTDDIHQPIIFPAPCYPGMTISWSPGEPKKQTGDPNLP